MCKKNQLYQEIKRFYDASSACSLEISEQLGMSMLQVSQIHYLKIIDEAEELTFSRFAEILQITKPSVTGIVSKLIDLGCVNKVQSPDDGRIFFIELTEKGQNIARSKSLTENKMVELIMNALDESEVETLIDMLQKINRKSSDAAERLSDGAWGSKS
ncbi:MAG: winged helix-turn-helix transcriptional regulator [Desulfobacteraceae bacterium]|nr:winged helix-turn-helix transcriptional regulator [Desulfobacteraceae bacterium]